MVQTMSSGSISTSTSSASGMTATVAVDGVDPAGGLGGGNALNAVDPRFVLEFRVNRSSADLQDGFL